MRKRVKKQEKQLMNKIFLFSNFIFCLEFYNLNTFLCVQLFQALFSKQFFLVLKSECNEDKKVQILMNEHDERKYEAELLNKIQLLVYNSIKLTFNKYVYYLDVYELPITYG